MRLCLIYNSQADWNAFHGMIHLLVIEQCILIIFVLNILLNYDFFFIPLAVLIFVALSLIYEYILLLRPLNSFYYLTGGFVFEFTNDFFIRFTIEFTSFRIITVIVYILDLLKYCIFLLFFCSNQVTYFQLF